MLLQNDGSASLAGSNPPAPQAYRVRCAEAALVKMRPDLASSCGSLPTKPRVTSDRLFHFVHRVGFVAVMCDSLDEIDQSSGAVGCATLARGRSMDNGRSRECLDPPLPEQYLVTVALLIAKRTIVCAIEAPVNLRHAATSAASATLGLPSPCFPRCVLPVAASAALAASRPESHRSLVL